VGYAFGRRAQNRRASGLGAHSRNSVRLLLDPLLS
jgi:hypothetical protein